MLYTHDISGCLAETVGDRGLGPAELDAALVRAAPALRALVQRRKDGSLPLLGLPARRDDLAGLGAVAAEFRRRFQHVLVLGIGGSSLGGQTLCALADGGFGPRPARRASISWRISTLPALPRCSPPSIRPRPGSSPFPNPAARPSR